MDKLITHVPLSCNTFALLNFKNQGGLTVQGLEIFNKIKVKAGIVPSVLTQDLQLNQEVFLPLPLHQLESFIFTKLDLMIIPYSLLFGNFHLVSLLPLIHPPTHPISDLLV